MFVVPKSTHNNNNSTAVTTTTAVTISQPPPSPSRANTVRMIAATKKPQSKITPIANITTTNNHISSDNNVTNSPSYTMVESNNESSNDATIAPVKEGQKKDGQKFEN